MIERLHSFGPEAQLFGFASQPSAGVSPDRPAFILLNAGLMHRAGPFRWYVDLARQLAEAGTLTFRFDHVGVGDGPTIAIGGAASPNQLEEQVTLEVRAAMDLLTETYGVTSFIVGGMCYGALEAHRVALVEKRETSLVLLDGFAYKTAAYYRELVLRKATTPASWPGIAVRVAQSVVKAVGQLSGPSAKVTLDEEEIFDNWPNRAEAAAGVRTLAARGVKMLFVYTGGWSDFVDESQFDEMFPGIRGRDTRVVFLPHADHSYLTVAQRETMMRAVVDFVSRQPTPKL